MVDIVRPAYGEAWASVGEKVSPTLAKIQGGWIQEMMPYQWENFLQNRQDTALLYMLQKGVPEWDASQEYIAGKSVVTYQTNLYISVLDSTNVLPTVQASWKKLNPSTSSSGVVTVAGGGTGANTAADARTNLGLGTIATATAPTSDGVVVRSDADTLVSRSITGTTNNIVVTNGDGVAGDISINAGSNVALLNTDSSWTSTGSIRLPSGSTSQQGASTPGRVRFNLETDEFHGAYSDGWKVLAKPASAEQTAITDVGNFYTSSNVEGALQEVGLKASFVKDAILSYPDYAAASVAAATLPDEQVIHAPDITGEMAVYRVNSGALSFERYLSDVISFKSYSELRSYAGEGSSAQIIEVGTSGLFILDPNDSESIDDGGTIIVGLDGRRWKRRFDGRVVWLNWFGAKNNEDATSAMKSAISTLTLLGGGVLRASGRYLLNTENIKIDSDNILIEGDGPGLTIFERTNPDIALFMFQWAFTNNTTGGGLLNCELIGVRNPTTGNGAIAFGTSVNHANSYQLKNVVVRKWGQYGVGLYNGSNWNVEDVSVYEHGHTTQNISSCMGFNVLSRQASSGGRLNNIYSAIGAGSLANSAAIKLEQHQNISATNIHGVGGTELCISISAIGGTISGVKCTSQGSYPGLSIRSRDTDISNIVGKFTLSGVECDDPGFTVAMVIGSGVGLSAHVLEGCDLRDINTAQFRVNNASSAKDCTFTNINCSVSFSLDHVSASVLPPNIAPTGNVFTNIVSRAVAYQGNNSYLINCCATNGGVGVILRGNNNNVKSLHSQGSTGNGLTVSGNNNALFDLSVSMATNASVFIQSGNGNILQGISYNPTAYHIADSGTGTKLTNLLQLT